MYWWTYIKSKNMGLEFALGLQGYAGQLKGVFVLAALGWEGNEVSECIIQCSVNSWKKKVKESLHFQTKNNH